MSFASSRSCSIVDPSQAAASSDCSNTLDQVRAVQGRAAPQRSEHTLAWFRRATFAVEQRHRPTEAREPAVSRLTKAVR